MLCAISGESPQVPVASKKSGTVFEKRLIEAYISEHGKDPVTDEELSTDDLVDLKSTRIVRPRPPTLTSIPSLLSVFQNEWDALALETYSLRQQLQQTRQELSTALYQNDAAIRVIARLTKERDEARNTLSKIGINGSSAGNGDMMQVDGQGLSGDLVAKVEATQERLSKTRRKRPVPEDWVTTEKIESFKVERLPKSEAPGSKSISVDADGNLALLGGSDGAAKAFSLTQRKAVTVYDGDGGAITDAVWSGSRAIVASSTGVIHVLDKGTEISSFTQHAGEITAIAVHPSGDILASVGVDKSIVLYDLSTSSVAAQIFTDSVLTTAAFHPDGHLFAAGGADGQIKIYDVKSGTSAANFDTPGAVQSLGFSENGTWLAVASKGQSSIQVWDLRKAAQIKSIEIGSPVTSVRWDYTGQFLATAGPSGLTVQQYSKSTKEWSEPLKAAVPSVAAEWGPRAESIVSVGIDGSISELR